MGNDDVAPTPSKSRAELWLNSAVVTALVTVVGGGIAGGIIGKIVEEKIKDRELSQIERKTTLDLRAKAVTQAIELASKCYGATLNLIELKKASQASQRDSRSVIVPSGQADQIRSQFSAAVNEWNSRKKALAALILYYHPSPGNSELSEKWASAEKAVDGLLVCGDQIDKMDAGREDLTNKPICKDKLDAFDSAMDSLNGALGSARTQR